jgi:hypothetical protein
MMIFLRFPSWRWLLLFALIAFMLTVIIILTVDQGRNELIVVGILAVAACVYVLSRTHALLPLEHDTICDIKGETKPGGRHYLAYITKTEKKILRRLHKGRGTHAPGINGTQGVPCFPVKRKPDDDVDKEKKGPYHHAHAEKLRLCQAAEEAYHRQQQADLAVDYTEPEHAHSPVAVVDHHIMHPYLDDDLHDGMSINLGDY